MSAEVKVGYKQSEVGVIPEDWYQSTIGELSIKVGSGITPRGGNSNYKDYGRPFVRSQNVGWGNLRLDDLVYIEEETHNCFASTELKEADVLLNITGASIGRSALVDKRLVGGNVNQHVCVIRVNQTASLPGYINYFLLSVFGQAQIDSFQAGGNREGLNFGQIKSIKLSLPANKAEQEAILEALSDADALIDSLEQLITKKRHIKQGAMQELLTGKKRLPGFSGEWEVVKAEDIGRFRGGSGFPSQFQGVTDAEFPFFKVSDMNNVDNETFMETANNYISETQRKQLGATAFPMKSIVIAKVGAAIFLERKRILDKPSCLDNNMAAFTFDLARANCRFIHYLFLNMRFGDLVSTTALPSLSGNVLSAIELVLPSFDEQTAITEILSDMDSEIDAMEVKLVKIRQIKKGMMYNLLTGKIRLILIR